MVQITSNARKLYLQLPNLLLLQVTQEQFEALATVNRDLRLERSAKGELIVNPPTGGQTGTQNWRISGELYLWWRNSGQPGKGFDSSTGFILSNGAIRSPDVSWISEERWQTLPAQPQKGFIKICPDFVVELRSESDSLSELQNKMQEYIDNGAKLGWLIDPKNRRVGIYRRAKDVEILNNPALLLGEDVLPGFVLNLQQILIEQ